LKISLKLGEVFSKVCTAYIKEHTDSAAGYEDSFFRIHIPIQTNDKVIAHFYFSFQNLQNQNLGQRYNLRKNKNFPGRVLSQTIFLRVQQPEKPRSLGDYCPNE
jgi:hypothetical protein